MPAIGRAGVTPFWCDAHAIQPAAMIAGFPIVRRVSVVSQVILASAVGSDLLARAEVLARLDRGLRNIGGLLNLHSVCCCRGPWAAPLPAGDENSTREG